MISDQRPKALAPTAAPLLRCGAAQALALGQRSASSRQACGVWVAWLWLSFGRLSAARML